MKCSLLSTVDTVVEVQFHIQSATWMSDAVKEKLLKRVGFFLLVHLMPSVVTGLVMTGLVLYWCFK